MASRCLRGHIPSGTTLPANLRRPDISAVTQDIPGSHPASSYASFPLTVLQEVHHSGHQMTAMLAPRPLHHGARSSLRFFHLLAFWLVHSLLALSCFCPSLGAQPTVVTPVPPSEPPPDVGSRTSVAARAPRGSETLSRRGSGGREAENLARVGDTRFRPRQGILLCNH